MGLRFFEINQNKLTILADDEGGENKRRLFAVIARTYKLRT
jgi:hypothetical protein